jgi:NADPH-ferrihemoprotein reductase
MALSSVLASNPIFNRTFYEVAKEVSKGAAIDDVAVLGILALASAGYWTRGKLWDKPDPYHHLWFQRPQDSDAAARNAKKETRNIAQKLEDAVSHINIGLSPLKRNVCVMDSELIHSGGQSKDVVIFWGSQSGTAEGFASRLARDCHRRFRLEALAADLSDFDPGTIALIPKTKLAIFIISTYGEGDPSDNTADFWNWLRAPTASFSDLRYMAFGLGNRNYKFYNRVIDAVVETLDKLQATSLLPVGRADDSKGTTEEDFLEWKEQVFGVFRQQLGLQEREPEYEPTLAVVEDDSLTSIDLHHGEPVLRNTAKKASAACSPICALPVKVSTDLFTNGGRSCLHMEIDLSQNPEIKYKTGDHLAVWPINPDIEVERLLRVLGLQDRKDLPISTSSLDPAVKVRVPTPTTADALFRHYLEICSPVSRETVLSLTQFAPTPAAKAFLIQYGSNKEAYARLLSRNYVTIGRLLALSVGNEATWSIPLSYLIETLPAMAPRYYSISSSSIVQPRQAAITAVVSDQQLVEDPAQRVHGLATNYLLALKQSLNTAGPESHQYGLTYLLDGPNEILKQGKLHVHIRKSTFKLPFVSSHPIIMVGAGTGIAPFRGFLQERARLKSMDREIGNMMLFFGCRKEDEDFLYREELQELQANLGDSLTVVTAFSRQDKKADGSKVYVQDRIEEHASELCEMLMNSNTHFYICGAASMARDVAKTLGRHLIQSQGWDEDQLRNWSERQKRLNRWQEDVWG